MGEDKGRCGVTSYVSEGHEQSMNDLHGDFLWLRAAVVGRACGDTSTRCLLDNRSRHIAAVASSAALGDGATMELHAVQALNDGVTEQELKELIYFTVVHAGLERATQAARALRQLLVRWPSGAAER